MNSHSHDQQNHFVSSSVLDTNSNYSNIISWLQTCFNNCVYYLSHDQEPHIWQKRDRFDHLHWYAHDPVTGRSLKCTTEDEVRVWLESVLYR